MKAAVCHEFGQPLVIEELVLDAPQSGEIKVDLAACAICHSDIHYAEGAWGGRLPAVYGHEASGVVMAVGENVVGIAEGDHVIVTLIRSCGRCFFCVQGDLHLCEGQFARQSRPKLHTTSGDSVGAAMNCGAFAEQVLVDQSQVVVIPKDVPLDSACLLACGVITGLGAVTNTASIPSGSSVAVIGVGGVGLNSIQGAVLSGAYPIIAIDLIDSKLDAAREFGATHTFNPLKDDVIAGVQSITQQRGADYVFVAAGSGKAIEQSLDLMRKGGSVILVGMPASGTKAVIEAANFAAYGQQVLGSKMGSTRIQIDIPKLVALYQQGRLKLDELITNRYPLDQINEAIAEVKSGDALRNVIVFSQP